MKTLTKTDCFKDMKHELKNIKKLQMLDEPLNADTYREPLSIDTRIIKKILLSRGGMELVIADGFELEFDAEKNLLGGKYYQANWGEYQEVELTEKEADAVCNFYLGGYIE